MQKNSRELTTLQVNPKKCTCCGCEIPQARLEAIPDVEYCVGCAEDLAPPETKADFRYDSDGGRPRHW